MSSVRLGWYLSATAVLAGCAGDESPGGSNRAATGGSAGTTATSGGTTGSGGSAAGRAATQGGDSGGTSAGTGTAGSAGAGGPCVESTCGSHKWACWKMPNPVSSPANVPNHQCYTDLGNGAVRDDITCLVWEKANPATEGTSPGRAARAFTGDTVRTASRATRSRWRTRTTWRAACAATARARPLNELASTVNEAKVGGAIDGAAFPGNPNGCKEPKYWFWAAEASKVGGTAWGLSYCDGFTGWNVGDSGDWNYFPQANVRCVR